MQEYLVGLEYKPTVKQLSKLLDAHVTTVLPKIHEYNLDGYVDI